MRFIKNKIPRSTFINFEEPIRNELFSSSHLEKYAEILALSHTVSVKPSRGVNLVKRLADNEIVLLESFRLIAETVKADRAITPAAEWLIDNFYIVEEQIKDIRDHLPAGYYKELPKLVEGPLIGYPRMYAIAWEFVAHTDSHFDPELLKQVLKNYQRIQPLTMGELWAISITLRIVLIENLRRLGVRIVGSQVARAEADKIADELLGLEGNGKRTHDEIINKVSDKPLVVDFAVQLVQRLRFQEGVVASFLEWLDNRLTNEGLSADKIVHDVHNSHTATNVTVRNIINSMRLMSSLDWRDLFEEVSLVEQKLQENPSYGHMDFMTRDKYRHSVEQLARESKFSELEVAEKLLKKTQSEITRVDNDLKMKDLGYYLISRGRYEFERDIQFKVKLHRKFLRWYISQRTVLYLGSIFLLTTAFVGWCIGETENHGLILYFLGLLAIFPASELAIAIVNRCTVNVLAPRHLPRLDFSKRIPPNNKTFVVVPTMLVNIDEIISQVDQLEIHYLSNPDDSIYFALLSDWRDSLTENLETDDLFLSMAIKQINHLNQKYGKSSLGKNRFFLFHRFRKWNNSELKWIGWERKRGKLQEFNHFLRHKSGTSFIVSDELNLDIPDDIVYVVTLDADTKLPRGTVAQLVGTFAHPLNHPKFDPRLNKVVEGYGILQPRITPTLPATVDSTIFQKLSSGPGGIDPYAAAISDVYQDLFGEGSYTGKGIYNVDIFEQALKNRTPENRLLSHDLFEGNFARCGLISDVELFEDFPSNFEVAVARNHRWTRGDWQLLPWILGREGAAISVIGRWKMFDNLRRSLLPPMTFFLLIASFCIDGSDALPWLALILASQLLGHVLPFLSSVFGYQQKVDFMVQLRSVFEELYNGVSRFILSIVFLPYHSWILLDAISRAMFRLIISKKNLLEWTTSAASKSSASTDFKKFIKRMLKTEVAIIVMGAFVVWNGRADWEYFSPLMGLWLVSPVAAWKISLPPSVDKIIPLSEDDIFLLRNSGRKIWHFFFYICKCR